MQIDTHTLAAKSRALRLTGRNLRLALLAVGVPVVLVGALRPVDSHGVRRWGPSEARAEPTLRGKFATLLDNPIRRVALAFQPGAASTAAAPFILDARSSAERARAVQCLANAVYYEAALEPLEGQRAVAQVVVNRVRDPDFPQSICGVVYQGWERTTGCQFSFTCDGSLSRPPIPALMAQARAVAEQALDGHVMAEVGTATHYHAANVDPWWRSTVVRVTQVGAHIFYRWPGIAGLSLAFTQPYAGGELKLSQDVIDGRAAHLVPPSGPSTPTVAVTADAGLATAAGAIARQVASGQRIHVVSYMPSVRRTPTPQEIAQIDAVLAKSNPPAQDGDKGAQPSPELAQPAASATLSAKPDAS